MTVFLHFEINLPEITNIDVEKVLKTNIPNFCKYLLVFIFLYLPLRSFFNIETLIMY